MTKMNSGQDSQADALGKSTGDTGTTSSAPTATTATDSGKSWTTNQWAGHIVTIAGVYGVILSNTGTVLTIDRWYTPGTPGGAAASTPSSGVYVIVPGNAPSWWMAVTENSTAPAVTDTTLSGELTSGGFARALATYAHTAGASTFTLSKTFTSSDGTARTLNKMATFNAQNAGRMFFQTAIPSPPTLVSGDAVTITDTISM